MFPAAFGTDCTRCGRCFLVAVLGLCVALLVFAGPARSEEIPDRHELPRPPAAPALPLPQRAFAPVGTASIFTSFAGLYGGGSSGSRAVPPDVHGAGEDRRGLFEHRHHRLGGRPHVRELHECDLCRSAGADGCARSPAGRAAGRREAFGCASQSVRRLHAPRVRAVARLAGARRRGRRAGAARPHADGCRMGGWRSWAGLGRPNDDRASNRSRCLPRPARRRPGGAAADDRPAPVSGGAGGRPRSRSASGCGSPR